MDPAKRAEANRLAKFAAANREERHRERALSYLGEHPEKFAREVLGDLPWTADMRRLADLVLEAIAGTGPPAILAIGGNALGKTHAVRGVVAYVWTVLGWQDDGNGQPRGCHVMMTAPTAKSIEGTIYDHLRKAGAASERSGLPMPGWTKRPAQRYTGPSPRSVSWWLGEQWKMEALTARQDASGDVAHSMSGRHHHFYQLILGEEGPGIGDGVWGAVSGLAAGAENVTIVSANPTSRHSPLYFIARGPGWARAPFSKLRHPHILQRPTKPLIPGAVDCRRFENELRGSSFELRGPHPETPLDPKKLDFVYALPAAALPEKAGPRPDGIPGHPDAKPVVLRPISARAAGHHLDDWLEGDEAALLFRVSEIRAHMTAEDLPERHPDRVGVDGAAGRPPWACPSWGPTAAQAIAAEMPPGSIRVGTPHEVPWIGETTTAQDAHAAESLRARYGLEPTYMFDRAFGQVGAALASLGATVEYVGFGDPPVNPEGIEGYGPPQNRRVEMAIEAAAVLISGAATMRAEPMVERAVRGMEAVGPLLEDKAAKKRALRKKVEIERDVKRSVDDVDAVWLTLATARAPSYAAPAFV